MLKVRHVAVNGALRHLQPLGEKFSCAQAPAADEVDEMEEAVGAAHGGAMIEE